MEHWHIIQHFNSVASTRVLSGVSAFHSRQGMDTSRSNRACILDDSELVRGRVSFPNGSFAILPAHPRQSNAVTCISGILSHD